MERIASRPPHRRTVLRQLSALPWLLPAMACTARTSRLLDLAPFDAIEIGVSGRMRVRQGPAPSIEIRAEPNVLAVLSARVRERTLYVQAASFSTQAPVEMLLSCPALLAVYAWGAAQVALEMGRQQTLKLQVDDAASIDADSLNLIGISADIRGTGSIRAAGKTGQQQVCVADAGTYLALGLESQEAEVEVFGAGHAELNVRRELRVGLFGAGTVRQTGPAVVRWHGEFNSPTDPILGG
ncbi:MAG: DUF2807 domain-containing protein [Leptothrix sp. (in: b-proteobacteria)]